MAHLQNQIDLLTLQVWAESGRGVGARDIAGVGSSIFNLPPSMDPEGL